MEIPKASKLFSGDINAAVIAVQKTTGIEITPTWWEKNVGSHGTVQEILDRFDYAYEKDYGVQIAAK